MNMKNEYCVVSLENAKIFLFVLFKLEEESTDESISDGGSLEDDEGENVLSFRDSELTRSQYHDDEEGDIGLGYDYDTKHSRLDESTL